MDSLFRVLQIWAVSEEMFISQISQEGIVFYTKTKAWLFFHLHLTHQTIASAQRCVNNTQGLVREKKELSGSWTSIVTEQTQARVRRGKQNAYKRVISKKEKMHKTDFEWGIFTHIKYLTPIKLQRSTMFVKSWISSSSHELFVLYEAWSAERSHI